MVNPGRIFARKTRKLTQLAEGYSKEACLDDVRAMEKDGWKIASGPEKISRETVIFGPDAIPDKAGGAAGS